MLGPIVALLSKCKASAFPHFPEYGFNEAPDSSSVVFIWLNLMRNMKCDVSIIQIKCRFIIKIINSTFNHINLGIFYNSFDIFRKNNKFFFMIKGCIFNLIDVVLKEVSNVDDLDPKFVTPDHLVDGFLVFLKELKNKGIQIAVVSHNPLLKEILDRLRITHLINNYFIGNNNESLSASTNIYKFAATSLQLMPLELIVFISSEASEDLNLLETFNIVCVGSKPIENTNIHHVTDFSSLKFNQLIASLTNISQN